MPDKSKIKVFKYGMSSGSKVSIPFGGQTPIPRVPVKTSLYSAKNVLGNRLAQKKPKKKRQKT